MKCVRGSKHLIVICIYIRKCFERSIDHSHFRFEAMHFVSILFLNIWQPFNWCHFYVRHTQKKHIFFLSLSLLLLYTQRQKPQSRAFIKCKCAPCAWRARASHLFIYCNVIRDNRKCHVLLFKNHVYDVWWHAPFGACISISIFPCLCPESFAITIKQQLTQRHHS